MFYYANVEFPNQQQLDDAIQECQRGYYPQRFTKNTFKLYIQVPKRNQGTATDKLRIQFTRGKFPLTIQQLQLCREHPDGVTITCFREQILSYVRKNHSNTLDLSRELFFL